MIEVAMRWGLTCDKGQCQEKVNKNGKEIVKICDFKPTIKQVEDKTHDSMHLVITIFKNMMH